MVLHDLPVLTSPVLGSTYGPMSLSQKGPPFSFSTPTFQTPCSYLLICFHIHGISPCCLVLLLWSYLLHDFRVHLWIPHSNDLYWSCIIDNKYESDSQEDMLTVLKPKNMIYTHWPCSICISYVFVVVTNKSDNFDLCQERFIWLTALVHHGREDLGACMTAQPWCQGIRCLWLISSRAVTVTKHGLQW